MTMLSAFLSFGSAGQPHYDRPPARPRQCPATPRRSNHPPAAARPTLCLPTRPSSRYRDHARESASPVPNSCVLQLHISRTRRRRMLGRPEGRSMLLEYPFRASIRNRRQPSLPSFTAGVGRGPGDRRPIESAAPVRSLRPSLRARYGTAHPAGSSSLIPHPSPPGRIGTHAPSQPQSGRRRATVIAGSDPGRREACRIPRCDRNRRVLPSVDPASASCPGACGMNDKRAARFHASPNPGAKHLWGNQVIFSGHVAKSPGNSRQVRRGQRRPAVSSASSVESRPPDQAT